MRLTLRTLLAYMDGLLDPKDSQEIGKKIEASKFATDLFHKIRDVMRRLRLAAPSLTERGTNLDCNTVAEYLDNALPKDRVPDFEEVSLKSEMHLAEVASCHQILTMVLGEPAEIDPESRQRMYQLPTVANRVDEERQAAVEAANMLSGDGSGSASPAPPMKIRPRPVVPEYLREPRKKSRLLPAAAFTFLGGAAVCLLLIALNQFNRGTPLGNALHWVQAKMHGKQADDEDRDDRYDKNTARPSGDSLAGSGGTVGSNGAAAPKSSDSAVVIPPGGNDAGKSDVAVPRTEKTREKPAPGIPSAVAGPGGKSAESKTPPGEAAVAPPPANPPGEVAKVDSPLAGKAGLTPPAVGPAVRPPAGQSKAKIGHYISDGQDVLLRFEANNAGWRRVLPEDFLTAQKPLLALPSYRPRVAVLDVNAMLELVNGTRIELLPANAQGLPGVDIDFGHVVIKPSGQAGTRLRVVTGSHEGIITLTGVDSIAGLEVTRVHSPGTDPEKVLSHALTRLYVARGGAVWEEGEGSQPIRLKAPAVQILDDPRAGALAADKLSAAAKELPKWLTANTVNELDQRAAIDVSKALSADRAASLGLMELTEDRRKEVRGLAARCLGYLGQFDPMTAALNDLDMRPKWSEYIDQLKEAIARGPETAAAIRQSLEKQYGNDAAALYRMLWGYTDRDLEDGEDARLVKFLEHESAVFRVLAFENLAEITQKSLYYHPEASPAKRLQAVQDWRRQQQAGRIRFNPPDVKPPTAPAELPSKETIPAPPKPLNPGVPSAVKPAAATEPIDSGAAVAAPRVRPSVSVPEPNPPERRPPIAFPEPQPAP